MLKEEDTISVLVVEDEEITRRALQHWLTARKFRVSTAANGASAIRLVIADRPDVILLDVSLAGGEDGLQLPKRLAEMSAATPFVVFTGGSGPRAGFEAHSLGACAILEKPALPDDIAAALRAAAAAGGAATPTALPETEHVGRAVAFIERHYATKLLSVSRIASEVGVSPDYLSRRFRQQLGCSMLTYLHRTRHRQAKRFLAGSAMSIKEIADACGYREAGELTRTFARLVGRSPTEYRLEHTHG